MKIAARRQVRCALVALSIFLLPCAARAITKQVTVGGGGYSAMKFTPAGVSIETGDTVEWTWNGGTHSVTSGQPSNMTGVFDSDIHSNGYVFSYTFNTAGNFEYFCRVHGSMMTGYVYVTPNRETLPKALNISTRMRVESGSNVLIGGFIITGNAQKNVAVRGIGPSLAAFGIPDVLADPTLELHSGNGALLTPNDDWQSNQADSAQLTSMGLGLQNSKESGMVATLSPGSYTAILAGKDGGTGIGLLEIYDTNSSVTSQLANISTRGFILTGSNVMIGGFILGGPNASTHVVVRGIGPSLAQFGLSPVLADPTLELHDGNGALLVANDDWENDNAPGLTSVGLAPSDAKESAIYTYLPPGSFTAILAGKNNGTGIGLVEVYNVH